MLLGESQVRTTVGVVHGKQLRFLAHVPMCAGDNCPIRDSCGFNKGVQDHPGRCKVVYNFLKSLYMDWVDPTNGLGDVLNQIELDRIGTHLMPLYHQLARFALEISALEHTTFTTKQGNVMAYPQFREVREVLKQIRDEMRDLNLNGLWDKKFKDSKNPFPTVDIEQVMQTGRPGAYEAMVERARHREKMRTEDS